jgi:hypothetical protein
MRVTALPPEIGKLIALFGPSDGYKLVSVSIEDSRIPIHGVAPRMCDQIAAHC